jgi:hypothetical protein
MEYMRNQNNSSELFFNVCFDKGELKNLIGWFLTNYGEKRTIDFLETLKQVGFHQATIAGVSLGLDDLQIPEQKAQLISQTIVEMQVLREKSTLGNITSVEKSQRMIDTWNQTSEFLRQMAVQHFRNTNPVNPVYMMAFSGARGNISQVRQLVAMRGLMADPQGVILEFPIQSNFREGLTITEYLISCYGARKGLVDTALRTATSGYLTRRLVDAVQHVVVTLLDCGTEKGVVLKDKNLESRLIGRILGNNLTLDSKELIEKNEIISPSLAKLLASQFHEILVRSPLTCEAENAVCQLCYGWNLAHGNLVSIGEAVGVIAAQSIGEPGTQLTMRTFHTGGVGVFADGGTQLFLSPFNGKVEFVEQLPGLFVRTPHGDIVYMVKYNPLASDRTVIKIHSTNSFQDFYLIKETDLPAGSILWVKQGENVHPGQLVAQSSKIKTSKQQMPESLHPVQSPIDGELYFESLKIVKQKQLAITVKKRQPKETEIGPTIRTLIQLGSFWVLGTWNQKEFHSGKSFLRAGDLVSKRSPLFQYNFHLFERAQLRYLDSELNGSKKRVLAVGCNYLNFSFSKIRFFKIGYFLKRSIFVPLLKTKFWQQQAKSKTLFLEMDLLQNPDIVLYRKPAKKNSANYSLLWYSHFFKLQQPTYCSVLKHYFEKNSAHQKQCGSQTLFEKRQQPLAKNTVLADGLTLELKDISKLPGNDFSGNVFLYSHPLFFANNFSDTLKRKPPFFLLTKNKNFLSKTGLFQVQQHQIIFDLKKKSFGQGVIFPNNKCSQKRIFSPKPFNSQKASFLDIALKRAESAIFYRLKNFLLKNIKSWIIVGTEKTTNFTFVKNDGLKKLLRKKPTVELNSFILEPGKNFNNIIFLNNIVKISLVPFQTLKIIEAEKGLPLIFSWYNKTHFVNRKIKAEKLFSQLLVGKISGQNIIIAKKLSKFAFYEIKKDNSYPKKLSINKPISKLYKFSTQTYFLCATPLLERRFPTKIQLTKTWFLNQGLETILKTESPLTSKQYSSNLFTKKNPSLVFKMFPPIRSNWFSSDYFIKINVNLTIQANSSLNQFSANFKLWNSHGESNVVLKNCRLGLNLFLYDTFLLHNICQFRFQTFTNNWGISEITITKGFIKIQQQGEFRQIKTTQNETIASILTNKNSTGFQLSPGNHNDFFNNITLGSLVRWGDEITNFVGFHVNGQIIKLTPNTITVRFGIPFLASARGILHVFHNDLIKKNQLLITLKSRRLQTEDIVQGIPKIEQLFEARETQGGELLTNSVHTKLQNFFISALQSQSLELAVVESIKNIQLFLIENILEAYLNQGVKISEKHVEIIVRQMTTRVKILVGGDTGLLPGELVQITWIQELNKQIRILGYREASYEPLVLGITKSVLQSESFLLAASFQEVSRVLVRSALSRKTDFLRGLHENVILGQLIPAGTGLLAEPRNTLGSFGGNLTDLPEISLQLNS